MAKPVIRWEQIPFPPQGTSTNARYIDVIPMEKIRRFLVITRDDAWTRSWMYLYNPWKKEYSEVANYPLDPTQTYYLGGSWSKALLKAVVGYIRKADGRFGVAVFDGEKWEDYGVCDLTVCHWTGKPVDLGTRNRFENKGVDASDRAIVAVFATPADAPIARYCNLETKAWGTVGGTFPSLGLYKIDYNPAKTLFLVGGHGGSMCTISRDGATSTAKPVFCTFSALVDDVDRDDNWLVGEFGAAAANQRLYLTPDGSASTVIYTSTDNTGCTTPVSLKGKNCILWFGFRGFDRVNRCVILYDKDTGDTVNLTPDIPITWGPYDNEFHGWDIETAYGTFIYVKYEGGSPAALAQGSYEVQAEPVAPTVPAAVVGWLWIIFVIIAIAIVTLLLVVRR